MRLLPYRGIVNGSTGAAVDGALLTLVDITKLREASRMLEDSIRKRDQFLAMLSHELRNPLSTIVNTTHVLHRTELPDPVREPIDVIRRQSRHMATLLDDLLDVTRVSQGKIHLERAPLDLRQAVKGAVEAVEKLFKDRGQHLETNLPEEPVMIAGSEPRMIQVVSNLLTNASKYSGAGEKIELRLESDGKQALVTVTDNGVGIAADQLQNIFEMFEQADRTLHRSDGGLGVGLTLVQALVDLHDGEVTIESDGVGEGCKATVTLPISSTGALGPADLVVPASSVEGVSVVVVEDNADAARMLALLLQDLGCHVSTAADGIAESTESLGRSQILLSSTLGSPKRLGIPLRNESDALMN